jgi:hypothetical protein
MKLFNHFLKYIFIIFAIFSTKAQGAIYPNLSGEMLAESRLAIIASQSASKNYSSNLVANFEPKFSFNLNREWSIKSTWDIASLRKRDVPNFEIGNVFMSNLHPSDINDYGLVIEELRVDYKDENMDFFFGKYNPKFGSAWEENKRIGVFTTDFTRDYELIEKIGVGISAIFETSSLTFSSFFNDKTYLSDSAINNRGRNKDDNIAGNNNNLASFAVAFFGENFLNIEDLNYNFGYRDLDVDGVDGVRSFDNETGYLAGFEYSMPISYTFKIIPFIEIARFNNFHGIADQDILYITSSIIFENNKWRAGISNVTRDIKRVGDDDYTDNQFQYFVGYEFENGLTVDVAHLNLKEEEINKTRAFGVRIAKIYSF